MKIKCAKIFGFQFTHSLREAKLKGFTEILQLCGDLDSNLEL